MRQGRLAPPLLGTPLGPEPTTVLRKFLDGVSGPVLVVHDRWTPLLEGLPGEVTYAVDGQGVVPGRWAAVVCLAADAGALRRLAALLPAVGKTRALALTLVEADRSVLLLPREDWPEVTALVARTPGTGAVTVVRFARPAPVTPVLQQAARSAAAGRVAPADGLRLARLPGWDSAPADDGAFDLLNEDAPVPADAVLPPDIVLAGQPRTLPAPDVTGRAPVVLTAPSLAGPVDERVLNPRGFLQRGTDGVAELYVDDAGEIRFSGTDLRLDPERGATAAGVASLRGVRAVTLSGTPHPGAALTLAGLAAAGVPLTGSVVDLPGLSADLRDQIVSPFDLDDDLRREEHSVRLRRAALLQHGTAGWRRSLAWDAGVPAPALPSVSVLLATRRPHMLEFAVRQFTRQRGVDAELVLVAHGFSPDEAEVRALVGDRTLTIVPVPADTLFGDALNAGVAAASGDLVMKMDDDDWYSPDFLLDLLVARTHSGADLVGTTSEYVYLEQLDRTLRRSDESERNARFVAGGTMLLSVADLRAVGGFRRSRRYVDASLLQSLLASGGSVYRAQGLGYVLRRTGEGHTWEPGLDFFLDPARMGDQWDGFVPSRLLEADPRDVPTPTEAPG